MTKASAGRKERRVSHCHEQVAKTAKGLCEATYESVMGNNLVRAEWKRQNPGCSEKQLVARFVSRNWAKFIPAARATLARLLAEPIDPGLKEQIHETLILDNTLIRGRQNPPVVLS